MVAGINHYGTLIVDLTKLAPEGTSVCLPVQNVVYAAGLGQDVVEENKNEIQDEYVGLRYRSAHDVPQTVGSMEHGATPYEGWGASSMVDPPHTTEM